jgi:hypothetical protein
VCEWCCEDIPLLARKCKFCTSEVELPDEMTEAQVANALKNIGQAKQGRLRGRLFGCCGAKNASCEDDNMDLASNGQARPAGVREGGGGGGRSGPLNARLEEEEEDLNWDAGGQGVGSASSHKARDVGGDGGGGGGGRKHSGAMRRLGRRLRLVRSESSSVSKGGSGSSGGKVGGGSGSSSSHCATGGPVAATAACAGAPASCQPDKDVHGVEIATMSRD